MTFFLLYKVYYTIGDAMIVYWDIVLFLNYLFDFILLVSVDYILKRNTKLLKIIFSSLVGEVSLLLLFINVSNFVFLLIKILISMVMIFICFGYRDRKYYFKNLTYFYLVSMLLGGSIQFLDNQFSYSNNGLVFTDNGLGISYVVVILISLFLYFKYLKSFGSLKTNYNYYYRCKIYINDKSTVELNAFLDTGNKLFVPYLGKSIVLVDKDCLSEMVINNPIYVPYNSLNNHGLLECYKCLKLEIEGKVYDKFMLGLSNEKFFMDGIDCIINNSVIEGLR